MAKIVDMPKLSPTMEEGLLAVWHKKEGDEVQVDDLLAEVETDKATMEFRAFDKGTILKLLVVAGSQVKLGQPVAIIGTKGEDVSALVAQAGVGASAAAPAAAPAAEAAPLPAPSAKPAPEPAPLAEAAPATEVASAPSAKPSPASAQAAAPASAQAAAPAPAAPAASPARPRAPIAPGPMGSGSLLDRTNREPARSPAASGAAGNGADGGRIAASPYVRKTARDRGIDLHGAVGSGPGGRVIAQDLDVIAARPARSAPLSADATLPGTPSSLAVRPQGYATQAIQPMQAGLAEPEARPLSMMRKTIARRLTEAKQTVPHFYLTIDCDAERFAALREEINEELAGDRPSTSDGKNDKPLKVSLNDLLIKACAVALSRVPECNASYTSEAILVHRRIDISVAVAVPDGLVTPVVRNADKKSLVAVAREVRELAARARAKKLRPEEMMDGTFSISNLGMFGIDTFAAVINPPEGAILAVGQVREEPVVKDGAVVVGKRLAMTLSCDHRVVDGAVGAAFLAELRSLIEHPMRVLSG